MPQPQHLDRLSAVDAAFLIQEGDSTHMHSSVAELQTAANAGTNGAGDRS
jgi:hypothetical protein